MENWKIYDLVTKKEVLMQDIKPYKMYLYVENNYCSTARIVGFDESRKIIQESYVTYEEQLRVATALMEEKYKKMGFTDVIAKPSNEFNLEGATLKVPHILVNYTNRDGKKVEELFNENTLEKMVEINETGGLNINISDMTIGDNLITNRSQTRSKVGEDKQYEYQARNGQTQKNSYVIQDASISINGSFFQEDANYRISLTDSIFDGEYLAGLEELAQNPNCQVVINQFGFRGKYDFNNPEDVKRFKKDIQDMPRNEKEANTNKQSQEKQQEQK